MLSTFIMLFISSTVLIVSWLGGRLLLYFIPSHVAKILSALFLIILGSIFFLQASIDFFYPAHYEEKTIKKIKIKSLGIIVSIIRQPASADLDLSGEIDLKEAAYLGIVLSIDALGVGLVASAYGIHLVSFIFSTTVMNFLFLKLGENLGNKSGEFISQDKLKFISSGIIVLLGIMRLI